MRLYPLPTFLLASLALLSLVFTPKTIAQEKNFNLALVATPSTSFVSGHETLDAVNDGYTPANSNDKSRGAYGNWDRTGTQWVQYDWSAPISTNKIDIYWFDDNSGVRVPAGCRVKYWNGTAFVDVPNPKGLGLDKNKFNTTTFDEITTSKLRVEMDGAGTSTTSSTGMLEFRVYDSGKSPNFPPVVKVDKTEQTIILGAVASFSFNILDDGKGNWDIVRSWMKEEGPGDPKVLEFSDKGVKVSFSQTGDYLFAFKADDNLSSTTTKLTVHVVEPFAEKHLDPVYTLKYTLNSPLWDSRAKALIVNWIPYCADQCDKLDLKEGGINNFIQAANKIAGKEFTRHIGYPFSNAWVLNALESMCVAQMLDANGDAEILAAQKKMRDTIERWIPIILSAQESDGYLQTRITLDNRGKNARWNPQLRGEHEGYVAGYFIEAGIAHYLMTDGKDLRLYNAVKKCADCWVDNIGPGKKAWYDGHQEMEQALVRLGRFVNDIEGAGKGDKYITLAKFLLDNRKGGSEYDQSHLPVTQQAEAVGHAVRAAYTYSAMADVAMETRDPAYQSATLSLWDNIVNKKYYLTGGIGSGETSEGFGKNYSLPNNTAYCESCSSCGMLFFQWKLNLGTHNAKYADLYEETLYNAILSDFDLDGKNFTYTNALDTSAARYAWHTCPCCVGNIPRVILMLPTWTYNTSADGLYVNLFVGSEMTVKNVKGTDVKMVQQTNYPWDGNVAITVNPAIAKEFSLFIRVPNRSTSQLYTTTPAIKGISAIKVNGAAVDAKLENGYVRINRTWKAGDKVEFTLPMDVQLVKADERVVADRGKIAVRVGPMVYNFESVDQDVNKVLSPNAKLTTEFRPDLLKGALVVKGKFADGSDLLGIPNFLRNNRTGRSVVWMRDDESTPIQPTRGGRRGN